MEHDHFKIKLKSKESDRVITVISSLLSKSNGLLHYPIEHHKWEILSFHQTTGFTDKNNGHIFFKDKIVLDGDDQIYQIELDPTKNIPIIKCETGHLELYKCHGMANIV